MSAHQKLAILTGTSSGIGAGLCEALLGQGWVVMGIARRPVDFANPNYQHVQADLADLGLLEGMIIPQIKQFLGQAVWGRVALINNAAAVGNLSKVEAFTSKDLSRVYAVNVLAPTRLMGVVSKFVPLSSWLRIVNISTGAVHRGIPGLADYGGSKAALRLSGMGLASEFEQEARARAAIFSYEPGVVDTEMQAQARGASDDFPSQELFNNFHASDALQPVASVIGPIVDFMNSKVGEFFKEERFNPLNGVSGS